MVVRLAPLNHDAWSFTARVNTPTVTTPNVICVPCCQWWKSKPVDQRRPRAGVGRRRVNGGLADGREIEREPHIPGDRPLVQRRELREEVLRMLAVVQRGATVGLTRLDSSG